MDVFLRVFILLIYGVGCKSNDVVIHCSDNPLCKCTFLPDNSLKLDCSGLQLDQCPQIYGNVTVVDLSCNNISVISEGRIPSSVIHLDIAQNRINSSDDISLKKMYKLETLIMSFNKIKYLDESSFRYGYNLRHLDISNCDFRNVMNATFRPLTQLTNLNISFNKYLTFRPLENITYGLQFTKIEVLDISKLHCTFGPGIVVFIEDLLHLKKSNLRSLYIDSNRISEFEKHVFRNLPQTLERLYIRDNVLSVGAYLLETALLSGLKSLDVSSQSNYHGPAAGSNEYYSCNDWRCPKQTGKQINDQIHRIQSKDDLSNAKSLGNIMPSPMPLNLENATFTDCNVKDSIPRITFTTNSLKRLTLRGNLFHTWEGPVENLYNLEYLDLSNNFCSNISQFFLSQFQNLTILNISNNLLGFVLNKLNNITPFQYLHKLKILDLSSNRLEYLKHDLFEQTADLSILILKSNVIKTLNFTIKRMKKLQYLDLANNYIQLISRNIREEITYAANTRNISINLENNQMHCECSDSFLEQLNWMIEIQHNHGLFVEFKTYTCMSVNGALLLADYEAVNNFERNCKSYTGVILGVLGAIVLSVSILMCGIVYRFRWRLRYLFYMTKNKYRGRKRNQVEGKVYAYDAFVSYSDEDSSFIKEKIIDELETKRGFHLCLHQRDFTFGKYVQENITDAIHSSRVTIAVITPSYINSNWCMFEFNMARMESVYDRDGDDTIFLILYKPVQSKFLPLNMLDLIVNKTYIEFPNEEIEGNVVFWEGLARGITL